MEKEGMMVVDIKNIVTRLPDLRFTAPVNWRIDEGQQWAVVGPNGAGKTLIADIMQRKFAFKEGEVVFSGDGKVSDFIKSIAFKDIYSLADCRNSYYQQRWHSTETEEMPTVEELLKEYAGSDNLAKILTLFGIEDLLPKRLIFLSSGELRKFLIVRTLLSRPRVLILDNPFIGLDAPSRDLLVEMLGQMTKLNGVQVVLLLSNPNDIPAMITHVLPIHDRTCLPPLTREEFMSDTELIARLFPTEGIHACEEVGKVCLPVDMSKIASFHEVTLRMEHVKIRYGSRTILEDLDWEIKNGEKWALFGPNGAGKSTLLSLVYADNPQSYANTLYLFDRKRGSGESIWDIKKRIGYVSPEMHLYYKENVPTLNIVGSGFFDSIGLFRKCNAEQETVALEWMKVFGIEHLKDRLFLTLSSGEQRSALLARAFVKDPDLIILDEPLHGLDVSNKKKAAAIIEQFCDRPGKTLIYVTHYPHELPTCVDKRFELVKHA
ncbi:ATP-binding cassette domain-containing protein [Parabacteroides distasonis]|uniref:ATP-binding cassette domain-containing protein n=1 Tax=Parabacteroides distasonis TaxID=823 RepID=UPI0018A06738|nr:ATP-binding cassette domain-containing protein [Parabacteroides distasonis]MDB9154119.1 ATP-binding cassette domain-containing protein [Parabacteroides distasonis]MDB9157609.1 ATP-binding cassette domain-containing protein [Parabacteroides distasonis]MDB9166474.1 ATP-binding cassette domain-containing protein [Parabacteroides distasonis]MDB9170893.1 ATP-binding cassette domain-containing protein [Parabacteroides distasonis]MDB9193822.1 ATP-binding cassette domain-containing protein [Parabac